MSIQNKPDYKVFASDAKSGEVETFPDILRGWGVTIDRTGEIPPMEWFNAIGKRADEWLLYLTQRGIPEWDSSLDYPKSAVVTHGDVIYVSLKASKGEQPDRVQAAWATMGGFLGLGNYYNKVESDSRFQSKGVALIPEGDNVLDYIARQDSGYLKSGGSNAGIPVPGLWNDFIWIKHGESHGRLLCLISNNKIATNTFAGEWLGWDIVPTSQDIVDSVSQVNSRVTSLESKVDNLPLLGVKQLYKEVTGRAIGTNYTNAGDKPIFVSIIFNNQNAVHRTISIDNNPIITINGTPEADQPGAVTFIVPIQSSYKVETNGTVSKWIELS